jgi:hypothetical protein
MGYLQRIVRSEGDPKLERSGPGSQGAADRLARALGWFSIGLGLAELLAPRQITRTLGMEGREALIRSFGAREIGAGVITLSTEKDVGLWSRVAGDGLDLASLATGLRGDNPKRGAVGVALAMVAGITVLDILAARALTARRRATPRRWRDYSQRSGFPRGVEKARGIARAGGRSERSEGSADVAAI